MRFILDSGHVDSVVIETPGLCAPSAALRALLDGGRVRLRVHGAPAPDVVPLDERERLESWPWADFGPLKRRNCTDAELYWQTRACGANDWYYLDGRLYPCARIACAVALGALRESDCAFAEVRRARGRRQVARDLERLTQPRPMEACRYCLRGTAAFTAVACEARTKLRQEGE